MHQTGPDQSRVCLDLEVLPAAALRVDPSGLVVEVNRQAAGLWEVGPEALIGQPAPPPPSGSPAQTDAPSRIPLADGSAVLLYRDPRQADDLREQVYHLSRLASVGRLVTTVVHEINNALSGIVGYSQLLLERELGTDERTDLERIYEEALRTSRVAQHLLRFSRGGVEGTGAVDVGDLLQRCRELKRRDFALKSIDLKLEVAPGLPPIKGNESLIFQVFVNLLTNAEESIHAHQSSGHVVVSARRFRGQVVVHVRDDGPGIPRELHDRVFQPFYTTRAVGKGTGLGLTICRDILREHGADISLVRSRGKGASFRLRFPVMSAQRSSSPRRRRRDAMQALVRNRHIVIIEDEPSVREVVTRAFTGHGNSVAAFERGEDALEYLEGRPVDLIISDIHRPGLDGVALFEHLRRTRPALARRLLFLSGDTVGEETTAFLRRSGVPHLSKPVLIDELQEKARQVLESPGGAGASGQGELFESGQGEA